MTTADVAGWLLKASLASSLAIVLVLLLRKPMRMAFGAGVAYALWGLVPVSLLAVAVPLPHRQNGWMPAAAAFDVPAEVLEVLQAASAPADAAAAGPDWMLLLTVCWFVGCLLALLSVVMRQRHFFRALGRLDRRADGLYQAEHALAGLPAVFGLWRACIVVPRDFDERFDAEERMLMQAHENAHATAGDLHANALAAVLRCVFWFNPLLYWTMARFRHDQEIACDARVLRLFPQARRQYGQAMLKAQLAPCVLPTTCHWGLIHPFKERIQMLRTPAPGALRWLTGLALVGTLCFGFGVTAWSAQPAPARSGAPAAATSQPRLGKVTLRLTDATPAEAARQAAEAIGVEVVGLDAIKNSERKINFSFIDSDAQMVFMLIAEEADVNVAFGEKKVIFSAHQ